jgi:site-specific recombinase XerD
VRDRPATDSGASVRARGERAITRVSGDYSKAHKRSWRTDLGRIAVLTETFGSSKLDEITSLEIERFRDAIADKHSKATAHRYRDLLSAIFKRALRDGHVTGNPVRTVTKFKENNERTTFLTAEEETAVHGALGAEHRPHFVVSTNTGLRWGEQWAYGGETSTSSLAS